MQISRQTVVTPKLQKALVKLIYQLNPNSPAPTIEHLEKVVGDENSVLFVLEEENEIVGTLSLVFYHIPTGRKAWIEDVVVDDKMRGRGFGKKLMEHAIAYARNEGVRKIYLSSNPTRIAANGMYQSLGFEQYITNVYFCDLDK